MVLLELPILIIIMIRMKFTLIVIIRTAKGKYLASKLILVPNLLITINFLHQ
jgi:hypothetical protein